jgi:ABC-2 type transport system permease protein
MRSLIAAELLKLRTTRMLAVCVGVVVLFAAALPIFSGAVAGHGGEPALAAASLADFLRAPAQLTGGAVLLIGLLAAAGEYRHRTIFSARLEEPRTTRLLAAKLITLAAVGVVVGFAMDVVATVVGAIVLARHHVAVEPLAHGVPKLAVVLPAVIALQGILGVAVGALLLNTAAAVGATLVWAFIIEGIMPIATGQPHLTNWLPSGAIREITSNHTPAGQLVPVAAAAVLLAYTAVLVTATVTLDRSREI